jgi:hypothetical protein
LHQNDAKFEAIRIRLKPVGRVLAITQLSPCKSAPCFHRPSRPLLDGWFAMSAKVLELRSKASDTEKITINLGYVDLGLST